jgi:cobalt-zinc-cadmium efflux system membrane fusion protein
MIRNRMGCVLALATLAVGCSQSTDTSVVPKPDNEAWVDPNQGLAGIVIKPLQPQDVPVIIRSSGMTAFSDSHVAHVYSPVAGRINWIFKTLGDQVYQGDSLCEIDSPDIGSAYSDYQKAGYDYQAAKLAYDRQVALGSAGTQADLQAAEDAYKRAGAELQRTTSKVMELRGTTAPTGQNYYQSSPINGQVLAMQATIGYQVEGTLGGASVATELFTIGDLHEMWAWLDVYQSDAANVKVGDVAYLKVLAYARPFAGTIDFISQQVDPTTHTIKVRVTVPNPGDRLKANMLADAVIIPRIDHTLAVPMDAVVQDGDDYFVFVQKQDNPLHFIRVPVDIQEEASDIPLPVVGVASAPTSMPASAPAGVAPVEIQQGWAEIQGGGVRPGDPVVVEGASELVGLM